MTATLLQGKELLITNSVTKVNSTSKKSRLTNEKIKLGAIVFERDDGVFFDNITFENAEWRPFYRNNTGFIELQNMNNKKACEIIVNEYKAI